MRRRQFIKTAMASGAGLLILPGGAHAGKKNEIEVEPPTGPTLFVGANQKYRDIKSAIADLPAAGGTIRVLGGTYEIAESIQVPSNTALIGEGPERTKLRLASKVFAHVITNANHQKGDRDILIKDLAIIGNLDSGGFPPRGKPTQGNDNCRGVFFEHVKNAKVEGCFITETGTNSFLASASDRIAVVGNTEKFCFHCLNFTNCTNCIVARNKTIRKWSGESPYFNNTSRCEVYDNYVEGVGMDGMALDFNSSHNVVHDNTIVGSALSGIVIQRGSHHNRIERNTIKGNGRYKNNPTGRLDGIFLSSASNNQIIENECVDDQPAPTQRYGINISNAECKDNELRRNLLKGNATGPIHDMGTGTAITVRDDKWRAMAGHDEIHPRHLAFRKHFGQQPS